MTKVYRGIGTLSVTFRMGPGDDPKQKFINLPDSTKAILRAAGLKLVKSGADANLAVSYRVLAVGSRYSSGTQYTAARVDGTISFEREGRFRRRIRFLNMMRSPRFISGTYGRKDAPYRKVFGRDCRQNKIGHRQLRHTTYFCNVAVLIALMKGPDGLWAAYKGTQEVDFHRSAIYTMSRFGTPVVPRLSAVLRSQSPVGVKGIAAERLGVIGDRRASGDLADAIDKAKFKRYDIPGHHYLMDLGIAASRIPHPAQVAPLIRLLGQVSERYIKDDLIEGLEANTGQSLGYDHKAWQKWWDANRTRIEKEYAARKAAKK